MTVSKIKLAFLMTIAASFIGLAGTLVLNPTQTFGLQTDVGGESAAPVAPTTPDAPVAPAPPQVPIDQPGSDTDAGVNQHRPRAAVAICHRRIPTGPWC